MNMRYEDDTRMVSMEEIERILTDRYGRSEYAREAGCNTSNGWLSVEEVLQEISREI